MRGTLIPNKGIKKILRCARLSKGNLEVKNYGGMDGLLWVT